MGDSYARIARSEIALRRDLTEAESRLRRSVHELDMRLIHLEGEVRRLAMANETRSDYAPLVFMIAVIIVITLIGIAKR